MSREPKDQKPAPTGKRDPGEKPDLSSAAEGAGPSKLSPEEQWELFEKELKETDWGHQPC